MISSQGTERTNTEKDSLSFFFSDTKLKIALKKAKQEEEPLQNDFVS